ncbi:hypothetical protein GQ42DRAFT_163799 [Ramicandelaber brevisporus]|nr:hypothetical protein GQ42DRAFT_163799 [Ramicandelaber brevisporus]
MSGETAGSTAKRRKSHAASAAAASGGAESSAKTPKRSKDSAPTSTAVTPGTTREKRQLVKFEIDSAELTSPNVDPSQNVPEPLIAQFPSVLPNNMEVSEGGSGPMTFTLARNSNPRRPNQKTISGDSERIAFTGATFGENGPQEALDVKYAVGVYDPVTGTVTVRPAPFFRVKRTVHRLVEIENQQRVEAEERLKLQHLDVGKTYMANRTALGSAFGSKAMKAELSAIERNKYDIDSLQGNVDLIRQTIEDRTSGMLNDKELEGLVNASRPVPLFNPSATTPDTVYDMEDVAPISELAAINISKIIHAGKPRRKFNAPIEGGDDGAMEIEQQLQQEAEEAEEENFDPTSQRAIEAREYALPVKSHFISTKLTQAMVSGEDGEPNRKRIRQLMYLAYMMKFRTLRDRQLSNRRGVAKMLRHPPEVVLDSLYERFTESAIVAPSTTVGRAGIAREAERSSRLAAEAAANAANDDLSGDVDGQAANEFSESAMRAADIDFDQGNDFTEYRMTQPMKDKLVSYILVLALAINNWQLYPAILGKDMSLSMQKISDYLRGVGCHMDQTAGDLSELQAAGVDTWDLRSLKVAALTAPIKFPSINKKRARK